MQRASFDGIALAYEGTGAGEPVLFIHGSLIADSFRPLTQEQSLRRYGLITYHRRGYGGSSRPGHALSIAEQAADARGLLRFLNSGRAHVVGHSFGGAVALQLVLDYPDAVRSLALLEPALMLGSSADSYRESLAQAIARYSQADATAVVEAMLQARWPQYREKLEAALPGAFGQALASAETTFRFELPGLLKWSFGVEEADKVTQPVLSVLGAGSEQLWPRFGEVHKLLLSWFHDSEGYVVPGSTHFLQVENPRDMAAALAAFLDRHPL
jgi:pimeloyl-ACP methyl ester carboxylesterase